MLAPILNADRSAGAFAQTDPWLLTTNDPNANRGNHGIFLGNGYLGGTFGQDGNSSGKDAVCFVAGAYDAAENLTPASAAWPPLNLPPPRSGEKYTQTLDLKRGVLTTQSGSASVTAFISLVHPERAVIHVTGLSRPSAPPAPIPLPARTNADLKFSDQADGSGSGWTRYVQVLPKAASKIPLLPASYEAALKEQETTWNKLWQDADIQIDGDGEAQQLVHKLMFDLLQSTRPGASDSIPPETLSGDFYKGHIFWDAEIWMVPALLAQHPDYAHAILEYRFKHLPEARAQAKKQGCAGADFPWESAASGNEVAPSGFSSERHITADIGWACWQYYLATQDKKWLAERGWPLLSAIADYWATRAKKNPQTGKYDVRKVFGPDELRGSVDNNTYTNAMARYCLIAAGKAAATVGQKAKGQWATVAQNLALPFDKTKGAYLARENDDGKATKQADGELTIYPAALPMDRKTTEASFDYNAPRPIKNGPAMTASIHALIAARLGRQVQAETAFRDAYRPFMRGPFLLFSEKRSLDRCVFTTGAGGVLQSVLYGFGGLDWEHWETMTKAPVTLPSSWKRLTITGIQHGGKRYTLTVTPQGRTLQPM